MEIIMSMNEYPFIPPTKYNDDQRWKNWPDQGVDDKYWRRYKPAASEPNHATWTDLETTLTCIASRTPEGFWCGYVVLPKAHPLNGYTTYDLFNDYDNPKRKELDDLVWKYQSHSDTVCVDRDHLYGDELPETITMLGFDCSHFNDVQPYHLCNPEFFKSHHPWQQIGECWQDKFAHFLHNSPYTDVPYQHQERPTYKTLNFVKAVCANLAQQIINTTETP
jgi:hypothetical protein